MIKPSHHPIIYPFFNWYVRQRLNAEFNNIILNSSFTDQGHPVLLLGNHTSWWDGFWMTYINQALLKRKLHIMMLEEQLARFRFFCKTGCFSIKKGSRSALASIQLASEILSNSKNALVLFPQGKLQSSHQQAVSFETGWIRIPQKAQRSIHLVFVVFFTDYFDHAKPSLFIYLQEYTGAYSHVQEVETAYNHFYEQCKNKHTQQSF